MARPQKQNADYHTHDKEMRNDPKIRALRKKFKHEGYSIYNMMLEVLTGSDNWKYPWNPFNIELLSGDFDTDKLEDIVNYCASPLNLFTIENGFIFSLQHQKRFTPLLSKRKRDIKSVTDSDNPHSIVEHSKEKESKVGVLSAPTGKFLKKNEKETKTGEKGMLAGNFVAPEFDEIDKFFFDTLKNYWDASKCNLVARKFYNHYKGLGWKTATDVQVQDWRAIANKWILDDLEKARAGKKDVPRHTSQAKLNVDTKLLALANQAYAGYKEGAVSGYEIPDELYSFFIDRDMIVMSSEYKGNILHQCNGDEQLAKVMVVAEYFKKLINEGVDTIVVAKQMVK